MPKVKRTYSRTSYLTFIAAVILTLVLDYYGISMEQVTDYASGVATKTFHNLSVLAVFVGPILIGVKEYFEDKRKSEHELQLELERLRAGK